MHVHLFRSSDHNVLSQYSAPCGPHLKDTFNTQGGWIMDTSYAGSAPHSMPPEHPPIPTSAQNVANATAKAILGQDLLACLVALMQPIILTYIPGAQDHSPSEVVEGLEGKRFISALEDLIRANVHAVLPPQGRGSVVGTVNGRKDKENPNIETSVITYKAQVTSECTPNDDEDTHLAAVGVTIPPAVPPTELETMTLMKTRAHVYNSMPIRLLTFDGNGSNPRLIGREEIFRRILPSVRAETNTPGFQKDWTQALELRDIFVTLRPRYDKTNALITDAIGRGAHYAILSHTWIRGSPGDVVFSDWKNRAANPQGYAKVSNFCRVAAQNHEMTLGWLDTVCINKDSSSELDESIRSMYRWYRGSHICITFLSETDRLDDGTHDSWFTRGWTLQELLAPKHSVFYSRNWSILGSTEDVIIQTFIEAETTITKRELDLCQQGKAHLIPLSRRMQMASGREVTREEDSSYSLLGLLGVDISIAYGEGAARAFRRLFLEVLGTTKRVLDVFNRTYFQGDSLIASSITRYSHRTVRFDYADWGTTLDDCLLSEPIIVTHLGVHIQCLLIPALCSDKEIDTDYVPKGQFSLRRKASVASASGKHRHLYYNMLDSRLYLPDLPIFPIIDDVDDAWETYAVINSDIGNGTVTLPEWCMSINLHTPDKPGSVGPSSKISVLGANIPSVFQLVSTRPTNSIPISELQTHGMQLVTLYL